jgi:hypothetical protein
VVLARVTLVAMLVASCGGDSSTVDAGGDSSSADAAGGNTDGAPPDAASCVGSPGGGCELVVDTADQCPSMEEVCAGVCGGSYDCCYCDPPEWQTIITDCEPCTDAGIVDSPAAAGPSLLRR